MKSIRLLPLSGLPLQEAFLVQGMNTVFALSGVPPLPAHGHFSVTPLTLRIRTGQARTLAEEMLCFFRATGANENLLIQFSTDERANLDYMAVAFLDSAVLAVQRNRRVHRDLVNRLESQFGKREG